MYPGAIPPEMMIELTHWTDDHDVSTTAHSSVSSYWTYLQCQLQSRAIGLARGERRGVEREDEGLGRRDELARCDCTQCDGETTVDLGREEGLELLVASLDGVEDGLLSGRHGGLRGEVGKGEAQRGMDGRRGEDAQEGGTHRGGWGRARRRGTDGEGGKCDRLER